MDNFEPNQEEQGRSINDLIKNGYKFSPMQVIGDSWKIFKLGAGPFIGFLFLYIIITILSAIIPGVSGASFLVVVPLSFGFYTVAREYYLGKEPKFSNFFDGFKGFRRLIPNYLAMLLIIILLLIPVVIIAVIIAFKIGLNKEFFSLLDDYKNNPTDLVDLILKYITPLLVVFTIILIPCIYFGIAFSFSLFLAYFTKISFFGCVWTSQKIILKKFWSFFGLHILLGLLNIVGFLCLGVGLLVTTCVSIISLYVAYEQIVGTRQMPAYDPNK